MFPEDLAQLIIQLGAHCLKQKNHGKNTEREENYAWFVDEIKQETSLLCLEKKIIKISQQCFSQSEVKSFVSFSNYCLLPPQLSP